MSESGVHQAIVAIDVDGDLAVQTATGAVAEVFGIAPRELAGAGEAGDTGSAGAAVALVGTTLSDWLWDHEHARIKALVAGSVGGEPDTTQAHAGSGEPFCGRRADGLPLVVTVENLGRGTDATAMLVVRRWGGPVHAPARSPAAPGAPAAGDRRNKGLDHVLSHDTRGALRNATNFFGLIARALPSEQTEVIGAHAEIVRRSIGTADALVAAIVRLHRLEQVPLIMKATRLSTVIAAAAAATSEPSAERGAATLAIVDTTGGAEVVGDAALLTELLVELLTNARKLGASSCTIEAGTPLPSPGGDPGCVVVAIVDDGIGIDASLAEDAFAPGRMLQPRGHHPGIGMGLPLARLIARRHGGDVWFDTSRTGPGAAVCIRLPRTMPGRPAEPVD